MSTQVKTNGGLQMGVYFPIYWYACLTGLDMALTLWGIHLNKALEGNPAGVNAVALLKLISIGLIILLYYRSPKYGRAVAFFGSSVALVCVFLWVSLFI